jgi:hypothetical protein
MHPINAATRALDEGQSEGLDQRLVIDRPLRVPERRPVDDETRRRLRELGLPDIIIDRWSQSQADLHLRWDGRPFDRRLVAQELAQIEEELERKRRVDEMMRQLAEKDHPAPEDPTTAAQPTVVETEPPPALSSPHEDALSFDQLKLGVYLPNIPADVLREYMSAIAGLVELDGGAPVPVDEQPMPSPAAPLDVVEAAPDVAEPSPEPLSPDAPIGAGTTAKGNSLVASTSAVLTAGSWARVLCVQTARCGTEPMARRL